MNFNSNDSYDYEEMNQNSPHIDLSLFEPELNNGIRRQPSDFSIQSQYPNEPLTDEKVNKEIHNTFFKDVTTDFKSGPNEMDLMQGVDQEEDPKEEVPQIEERQPADISCLAQKRIKNKTVLDETNPMPLFDEYGQKIRQPNANGKMLGRKRREDKDTEDEGKVPNSHNNKTDDNFCKKIRIKLQDSVLSFGKEVIKHIGLKESLYPLDKVDSKITQYISVNPKNKDKTVEINGKIIKMPLMKHILKAPVLDSLKYAVCPKIARNNSEAINRNITTIDAIFRENEDEELNRKLKELTLEQYYTKVFLNKKTDIFGEKYKRIFENTKDINEVISNELNFKGDSALKQPDYIKSFKEFAENKYLAYYNKK
ncbi:MAG: hypothetical protein MJ252_30750 [archaeon]|nr:hypothetical protein [archaeon]